MLGAPSAYSSTQIHSAFLVTGFWTRFGLPFGFSWTLFWIASLWTLACLRLLLPPLRHRLFRRWRWTLLLGAPVPIAPEG